MKDLRLIFVTVAAAILSAAELAVMLMTVPPSSADSSVLWAFFGSAFVFLASFFSLVWHPLKSLIHRSNSLSRLVSTRQAALVSGIITVIVFLKSLSILSPWDLIPIIASAVLIEFFFEADKRPTYNEPARTA